MWMSEATNMHRFAMLGRLRNPVQQLFTFDSKYSNLGKVMNYTLFFYQVRVICLRVREIYHCCRGATASGQSLLQLQKLVVPKTCFTKLHMDKPHVA